MITKERVVEELQTVFDPEIGLDVYTLGLIYDIDIIAENHIVITMTYTTPLCPYGPAINVEITDAMRSLGFGKVELEITFDPPWKPPENLREMMGV